MRLQVVAQGGSYRSEGKITHQQRKEARNREKQRSETKKARSWLRFGSSPRPTGVESVALSVRNDTLGVTFHPTDAEIRWLHFAAGTIAVAVPKGSGLAEDKTPMARPPSLSSGVSLHTQSAT